MIGIGRRNYLRSGAPRHNNVLHKRWAYLRTHQRQRSSLGKKEDASPLPR